MKPRSVEASVERGYCAYVREHGGEAFKFVSPGLRGVPDRLMLYAVPPEHRALVAMYVKFVEFKAPGKKPTPTQIRKHKRLRAMGFSVEVVDGLNVKGADK